MSLTSCHIRVGNEQLHYLKTGNGPRMLLAFHGYGHEANNLTLFAPYLSEDYTCLFFDLPHHGESGWAANTVFTEALLIQLIQALIKEFGVQKISLLGSSIGGRVCLSIVYVLPGCIDKVTLLASDCLRVDPYFHFFTTNPVGKKVFRHMLSKPGNYLKIAALLKKTGLVHEKRYKFVLHYLDNDASRKQLGNVWPAMAGLSPEIYSLKKIIQQYDIPITIFMGRYDKIIPPSVAEKFKMGLDSVHVIVLDKGHRIYDASNAAMIAGSLLHNTNG